MNLETSQKGESKGRGSNFQTIVKLLNSLFLNIISAIKHLFQIIHLLKKAGIRAEGSRALARSHSEWTVPSSNPGKGWQTKQTPYRRLNGPLGYRVVLGAVRPPGL